MMMLLKMMTLTWPMMTVIMMIIATMMMTAIMMMTTILMMMEMMINFTCPLALTSTRAGATVFHRR